jgi:thymidylate synthase (FAD)
MAKDIVNDNGVLRYAHTADRFGARPILPNDPLAETSVHTYGNVGLIATFGSDELIARAARTSYGKGTATVRDNEHLIRYLLRHRHTSPFEQAELTFYLRMPIFCMRQLVRHRTANINEYSARYSELSDDFYVPAAGDIQPQTTDNRQGRSGTLSESDKMTATNEIVTAQEDCVRAYRRLLDLGVARELSRVVTTVGMYTECYYKMDLHNFMHLLKLRLDPHAQKEVRDITEAMYACAKPYFKASFAAFEDYIRNAYTMSAMEIQMLSDVLTQFAAELRAKGWPSNTYNNMSAREYIDFKRFLDTLVKS